MGGRRGVSRYEHSFVVAQRENERNYMQVQGRDIARGLEESSGRKGGAVLTRISGMDGMSGDGAVDRPRHSSTTYARTVVTLPRTTTPPRAYHDGGSG